MMRASSVGSHSSRYIATCASVTRRRSGQTSPYTSSETKTATEMMRNAIIAGALKRSDSRDDAEGGRARDGPANTKTAPRRASRQRPPLRRPPSKQPYDQPEAQTPAHTPQTTDARHHA